MSVISRSALESSSLADLHEIASELGLDGYRRLRKADLVGAIIERQGGDADAEAVARRRRGRGRRQQRRRRRGRRRRRREARPPLAPRRPWPLARPRPRPARNRGRGRERRGERSRSHRPLGAAAARAARERRRVARPRPRPRTATATAAASATATPTATRSGGPAEEREASGTVELLPNGSGFLRVSPPEPSDDDVYISAAQVRRCELVAGDQVAGPVRAPRRSERYPSLIRVDTINGRSADEVSEGTKYDDLPCTYATERMALDSEDATLKAIEWLTPFGRGSRVALVGGGRAPARPRRCAASPAR